MLNASEQFEAVKEYPEAWSLLEFQGGPGAWFVRGRYELPPEVSYYTLLGLFAAATGCGVISFIDNTFRAFDEFEASDDDKAIKGNHPDRLLALVAAYRAGVRA